jgi:hypothetical protein
MTRIYFKFLDSKDNPVETGNALIAAFLSTSLHFSLINQGRTRGAMDVLPWIMRVRNGKNDPAIWSYLSFCYLCVIVVVTYGLMSPIPID